MRSTHTDDEPFFRADEQAAQGIPVRDEREAGPQDRPRGQGVGGEARAERPLSLRLGQATQEVLPWEWLVLMV